MKVGIGSNGDPPNKTPVFNHGPFLVRHDSLLFGGLPGLTSSITPRSSRATPGAATTSLMRSDVRRFDGFGFDVSRGFGDSSLRVPLRVSLGDPLKGSLCLLPHPTPKASDVEGVFWEGHVYTLG